MCKEVTDQLRVRDALRDAIAGTTIAAQPRYTLAFETFYANVALANIQACGGVDGQFPLEAEITTNTLTPEGWVVEVEEFIDYVKEQFGGGGKLKASCEELAGGVVRLAYLKVGERMTEVKVKVYNLTGHVEVIWQKGQAVPPFPRQATREEQRGRRSRDEEFAPVRSTTRRERARAC